MSPLDGEMAISGVRQGLICLADERFLKRAD
jgi:hypothetical protein